MGAAFARSLAVQHADPNGSAAGTFTAAGSSAVPVRAIISKDDTPVDAFSGAGSGVRHAGFLAWLLKSDVPDKPREGDALTVADDPFAGDYRVLDAEDDALGGRWKCSLARAA